LHPLSAGKEFSLLNPYFALFFQDSGYTFILR